jgi:hypothetical protein
MKKQILSEEFLRMQKLAGIISESKTINLNEMSLNPDEQNILDDIISSLNEGDGWVDKIKKYAKKGVLTLAIIASLLGGNSLTSDQKEQVVDTVKKEAPQNKESNYLTDAWTAHNAYSLHKDKIDQLAKENVGIEMLVKDLSKFDSMSTQEQIILGKTNQDAIKQISTITFNSYR